MGQSPLAVEGWPVLCAAAVPHADKSAIAATDAKRTADEYVVWLDHLLALAGDPTQPVWDTSGFIAENGTLGSVLRGLMGYNPRPTVGELILYLGYLVPVIFLFWLPGYSVVPATLQGYKPSPFAHSFWNVIEWHRA